MRAIGIGDGAVLLAPGERRQQHVRELPPCRCCPTTSETTTNSQLRSAALHLVGVRQADYRIGRHDPHGLDACRRGCGRTSRPPSGPGGSAMRGLSQNCCTAGAARLIVQIDVCGERVREAADFAAAHGIGLARDRERPGAGFADAPGGKVTVDDGVDLVGARRALVHALRERRDHGRCRANISKNSRSSSHVESARPRGRCE